MNIKEAAFDEFKKLIESRIRSSERAIEDAKEAGESETKSSAGDKYETGREMMQQEITRNQHQLAEARKLLFSLQKIPLTSKAKIAGAGSLIYTNQGAFLLSVGAGQVQIEGTTIVAISPASPVGQKLAGISAGEKFTFNGKEYIIEKID